MELDQHMSIHQVTSTSFLPLVFSPPGCPLSVHFAIYLSISGREADFLDQISQLSNCIDELNEKYEDCLVFIRGDGNVNSNNIDRMRLLKAFLNNHSLMQVVISHKTYHHFLGGGSFDSNVDIILQSKSSKYSESVTTIYCKHDYPDMDSHHDAILSSVFLPLSPVNTSDKNLVTAPRLDHSRYKILWSEEGIERFQEEVANKLHETRLKWLNPLSKTSLAILLALTNDILSTAAIATNKSVNLNSVHIVRSKKKPQEVRESENYLKTAKSNNKTADNIHTGNTEELKTARKNHRFLIRSLKNKKDHMHNENLFGILESNPTKAFSVIKSARNSSAAQVPYIRAGDKQYTGDKVADGLFDNTCVPISQTFHQYQ